MKIKAYKKGIYGNDLIYISDKGTAEVVSMLTNKKTINMTDIDALTWLGHEVILSEYGSTKVYEAKGRLKI